MVVQGRRVARRGPEYIGTMEVQAKHRFDERSLERFMIANVAGFTAPVKVEQFKGGQSNPTYRLTDAAGRHYVLRRKPPGKLLPSAHAVDREFRVIAALNKTDVPTPHAYALCEDADVVGTPFYIMEYCDGRVLWDPLLPEVPKEGRLAIYREKFEVLARLHAVDYAGLGLADFGRPGSYVARQISRWGKQYKASETETIEAMDKLLDWLPAHLPASDETVLVHGDYRLDNMIFALDAPRVLAVVDWELSTLGHPLADFAYHVMAWRAPRGEIRGLKGLDLAALGIPTEPEYVATYCARTGRSGIDPAVWEFCMAYNLFRIASIRQGIMKRVLEGTAASRHAREAGARARETAELAWQVVEERFRG
jgi:aminoglycoside phosphotransferase (APT) family kinase protein